jgi:transposase
MPQLRQNEREQAVGMLLAGMAQTQIANHFNVSRMTIYRLMIHTDAICSALSGKKFGHWFYQELA